MNFFIHMGLYKTGTTAIQKFLSSNREQLAQVGYLYPEIGTSGEAHYPISWGLNSECPQYSTFNAQIPIFIKKIEKEAKKKNCRNVLLSAETFADIGDLTELREVFDRHQVKIIVYLRRQDRLLHALYCQRIASNQGLSLPISDIVKNELGDLIIYHERLLDNWSEFIGEDNITVRVYERRQLPHGLHVDLLEAILVNHSKVFVDPGIQNMSLPVELIDLVRFCNCKLDMSNIERKEFKKHLTAVMKETHSVAFSPKSLLTIEERVEIINRFAAFNKRVAQQFLGRADGRLFYENLTSQDRTYWRSSEDEGSGNALTLVLQLWLNQHRAKSSKIKFLRNVLNSVENKLRFFAFNKNY